MVRYTGDIDNAHNSLIEAYHDLLDFNDIEDFYNKQFSKFREYLRQALLNWGMIFIY